MMGTFLFLTYYLQQTLHYSAAEDRVRLPSVLPRNRDRGGHRQPVRDPGAAPDRDGHRSGHGGRRDAVVHPAGLNSAYWPHVFPAEIVMSLGMGLVFVTVNNTALAGVQPSDSGVASALINASQQVGGSVGTALLNTIAATATATYVRGHAAGTQTLALGTVHGYSVAFAVAAGVLGLALLTVLLLVNVGPATSGPAPDGADGVISEEAAAALAPMLA